MRKLFLFALLCPSLVLSSDAKAAGNDSVSEEQPTSAHATPQMIAVDVKLIEISKSKMRKLGFDFAKFDGQELQTLNGLEVFDESPTSTTLGFVEALMKNKLGRVLASPRVMTLDGKEASLSVGSQVETKVGADTHFVQLGTRLQIEPKLLSDNKVQLDFRLEWTGRATTQPETKAINNRRNYEVQTSIAPRLGESTLLARSLEVENEAQETEEVVLLLVVTPELIETTTDAKQTIKK